QRAFFTRWRLPGPEGEIVCDRDRPRWVGTRDCPGGTRTGEHVRPRNRILKVFAQPSLPSLTRGEARYGSHGHAHHERPHSEPHRKSFHKQARFALVESWRRNYRCAHLSPQPLPLSTINRPTSS